MAMFRSSGGPRQGLIEDWIAAQSNMPEQEKSFKLATVLRKNAAKRLSEAVGPGVDQRARHRIRVRDDQTGHETNIRN